MLLKTYTNVGESFKRSRVPYGGERGSLGADDSTSMFIAHEERQSSSGALVLLCRIVSIIVGSFIIFHGVDSEKGKERKRKWKFFERKKRLEDCKRRRKRVERQKKMGKKLYLRCMKYINK
jgi:hypothetical protein